MILEFFGMFWEFLRFFLKNFDNFLEFFGEFILEFFGNLFGNSLGIWKKLVCLSRFWILSRFCLNGEGRRKEGRNLDP